MSQKYLSKMKISEITGFIESVASLAMQESYDNAGLIVGDREAEATGALICLDVTEEVVDEAISLGFNLIIAHHPFVFSGLKKFSGSSAVERTLIKDENKFKKIRSLIEDGQQP